MNSSVQVRPARPDEYEKLVASVGQPLECGLPGANAIMATIRHDARFVPEHLCVVEVEDEQVGVLLLIDRLLQYGSATLHCAILAPFELGAGMGPTAGTFAMCDTLRWAATQGFHLALRWAATDAGADQGFAPGSKTYAAVLPAAIRPSEGMGYTTRPATATDASALAACYRAATETTVLAETRGDDPWQWRPTDERQRIEVAVDPLGVVRGYARVVHGSRPLQVPEVALMDDGPASALVGRLLQFAAGGNVRVTATPENRWSRWAFAQGASLVIGPGDGRGAVRLLDLAALLQTVRPELERRLEASEFVAKTGQLCLETPLGSLRIVAGDGRLAYDGGRDAPLVTLPWGALGSLVTGYRGVESLLGQPGVRIEGIQTLRLLQVLFPEGYPHWSPPVCF
ncbi:MAG TPA: hypothetical protein VEZ12_14565 [Herpetosiphonaceae bacterium]|nr:hypothetical protein [Herpetosiphonaceae bacterium]